VQRVNYDKLRLQSDNFAVFHDLLVAVWRVEIAPEKTQERMPQALRAVELLPRKSAPAQAFVSFTS
jgi:hypothetical protein